MQAKAFNKAMGIAIRRERKARGLSQDAIASALGVAPQQLSKYELGTNGFSAQMLVAVAKILQVPVAELYERARINIAVKPAEHSPAEDDGFLAGRYVAKIRSDSLRRNIIEFARKCAYEGNAA
jgi:transcriptional regulator with XRE-family HTH domain